MQSARRLAATLMPTSGSQCEYFSYLWSTGNEGMEKKMETTMMGYIGFL